MAEFPKQVTVFETSDRTLHRTREFAEDHQRRIEGAKRATAMLEQGASLGTALRENGFLHPAAPLPELDEVGIGTKLIISHWQCRDEPGYTAREVDPRGMVFVYGHAGSWSGPFGEWITPSDVAHYWRETKRRSAKEGNRG